MTGSSHRSVVGPEWKGGQERGGLDLNAGRGALLLSTGSPQGCKGIEREQPPVGCFKAEILAAGSPGFGARTAAESIGGQPGRGASLPGGHGRSTARPPAAARAGIGIEEGRRRTRQAAHTPVEAVRL